LILSVPLIGVIGAAIALLLAEIAAAIGYKIHAKRWLKQNQLLWPRRPFNLAITSVVISALTLIGIIWISEYKWIILTISMLLFAWNFWRFWQVLPAVAIESAKNIISKIPGFRRLLFLFDMRFI
jgi:hypothetical protein